MQNTYQAGVVPDHDPLPAQTGFASRDTQGQDSGLIILVGKRPARSHEHTNYGRNAEYIYELMRYFMEIL